MAYRALFFGTADFSVPLIEQLAHDTRFELIGVVTQPDRPAGRKGDLAAPATKQAAEILHIPVFQFESVKPSAVIEQLTALKPDVIVVASFGQIMPQALLDIAPKGAINFHWSLLPKYRGASPIQGAIMNGDTEIGATVMLMDAKMDHGDMLAILKEQVLPEDTADSLYHRLGKLGAPLLANSIIDYLEGRLASQPQDHAQASFVKLLAREDGHLDTSKTAEQLERQVRALDPWPGTYFLLEGKRLKVLKAALGPTSDLPPGTTFQVNNLPAVTCSNQTSLLLTRVQPEGKPAMDGSAFARGRQDWERRAIVLG